MTREEVKTFLPIMQAYVEGKQIQHLYNNGWKDVDKLTIDLMPELYRIKPEPKYRPFKDAEECWKEMQKHRPFGWIKSKDNPTTNVFTPIVGVEDEDITVVSGISFTYDEFLEWYVFADDTPCGIKEEE